MIKNNQEVYIRNQHHKYVQKDLSYAKKIIVRQVRPSEPEPLVLAFPRRQNSGIFSKNS